MERALELAALGEGKVNPNPMVGAVVVKDGKIVGEGYHKKYGGPHAEVFALGEAGKKAEGATIYVTLEPCSHYGKTPPCAKKIIDMGIKRCIIASLDPNPLVSGRGIKMMTDAGIEVITGIMEKEASELNRVFMKYISTKVPYLFLKCGITLDGKIASRTGNSKWITNELAREKVQKLRNKYMGIMVGINTILADNPSLTARIENARNPYRIVIDPFLDIPIDSKFVNFEDKKSILITSYSNVEKEKISFLKKKNINVIFLKGIDFKLYDILKKIGDLGIDAVLLEGGSFLISKAFSENIIDGGEIFIAPKILGDDKAIPFIRGFDCEYISDGFQLTNVKINNYGNNVSMEFYR
ncbi:bifunctional diaminohydroxyphosphoribosylaminopyrimidine deaminase/5-amino-6-(5-phosphoribosylamino)uracil reductase RibD [Fusobacterium sp.]|uniref:bifunctional diaminohydroxyphosphoribosylaminopyrimidine deaminase/5-amino-6-(5-phosphoribosylamino)uracil reductase RibD n=1 Tax=Fusobacterium sp. TaxID=68766 RepID=UPI0029015FC9|nr:bifunctional diaminohydroxyphosphoribosylaminopyrimidine deaminase/5-amino-6-(5-phosphoribosylamino)uracil reductase RibD [Fusobacterium sp.]MDU1910054.1 bifunctional diaminohydroxyphosphoribosylaminopyrimidine deaminase/5-amino-6-(5-phosphoribosylamino)uracil reductase RibD [Fusobacterium sp.]